MREVRGIFNDCCVVTPRITFSVNKGGSRFVGGPGDDNGSGSWSAPIGNIDFDTEDWDRRIKRDIWRSGLLRRPSLPAASWATILIVVFLVIIRLSNGFTWWTWEVSAVVLLTVGCGLPVDDIFVSTLVSQRGEVYGATSNLMLRSLVLITAVKDIQESISTSWHLWLALKNTSFWTRPVRLTTWWCLGCYPLWVPYVLCGTYSIQVVVGTEVYQTIWAWLRWWSYLHIGGVGARENWEVSKGTVLKS